MNKAILMSIQPKWLVKILNGEKTIQIRKTMPKCELPIDVYLYCTKGKPFLYEEWDGKEYKITYTKEWQERANEEDYTSYEMFAIGDPYELLNGLVVAKFTLKKVDEILNMVIGYAMYNKSQEYLDKVMKKSCLTNNQLEKYLNKKDGYAWHIDNLVIFDKPMELRDFSIFIRETISCGMDCPPYTDWVEYRVRKAPKSWQYAYVEGETK